MRERMEVPRLDELAGRPVETTRIGPLPFIVGPDGGQSNPTIAANYSGVTVRTPSSSAFASFDPAPSPATSSPVFFDTEPAARPPFASISSFIWVRPSARERSAHAAGDDDGEPRQRQVRGVRSLHLARDTQRDQALDDGSVADEALVEW